MGKNNIVKIVGEISREVAESCRIKEYEGQTIVQSLDLYIHIAKHAKEFKTVDHFNQAVNNIENIIKNPYFVYYEKEKNSLHYFAELDEYTCIIVKLNLKKNKDNYVSTIYPISKNKINKLKEKSYIITDD